MGQFIGAKGLFTKDQGQLDPIAKAFKEMYAAKKEVEKKPEEKQLEEDQLDEIDPAKVKALYDRPGTPGEKAAAAAALHRMGHGHHVTGAPKARTAGPRKYKVTLKYHHNGKDLHFGPHHVEASDEIDAEHKVRKHAHETWKTVVGKGIKRPTFHAHETERV